MIRLYANTAPDFSLDDATRQLELWGREAGIAPPYRLVPSFASADGQSIIYRRRSQVVMVSDQDGEGASAATSFAMGDGELKVRIDQYGYARLVRPSRTAQHVDPVSNTSEGADEMEREAALAVCAHLNENVATLMFPHRWTPAPGQILMPAARPFSEPKPEQPKPAPSSDGRSKAVDKREFSDYLDARAAWLARRLAWDASQRALHDRKDQAVAGDVEAMREHLLSCLHDVLWPVPTSLSFDFIGAAEAKIDFLIPSPEAMPDREAAIGSGNRVAIRRMTELVHTRLHNIHGLGLVVRLIGEVFAALPTIQNITVSAIHQPTGKPTRFVSSARAERSAWSALHAGGFVTADLPTVCLQHLKARYNMTGLGVFIPIEPFD
jgi:hypothetical protein